MGTVSLDTMVVLAKISFKVLFSSSLAVCLWNCTRQCLWRKVVHLCSKNELYGVIMV